MSDDSDTETTSVNTRWEHTNDVLAGLLVLLAIGSTGVHLYRGTPVPMWLYLVDSIAIVTAVVWAFGGSAFSKAAEFVGGGGK